MNQERGIQKIEEINKFRWIKPSRTRVKEEMSKPEIKLIYLKLQAV